MSRYDDDNDNGDNDGNHDDDQDFQVARHESRDGNQHRDSHADNPEQVATTRRVVGTQTTQRQNKQRRRGEIRNCNQY